MSFPGLTGTGAYFFDSVSLSAFARVASRLGLPEASLLYSLAPMAIAALTLAVPLRRRGAAELFALLAISISAWMSLGVYATDRLVTTWSVRTFGSSPPDWLDRSHLGPARYLALPYANTFYGTLPRVMEPRPARRRPARHATAGPLPRRGRKRRP